MTWQPEIEPLKQLVGYLRDALSGHDQNAQNYATLVRMRRNKSPTVCTSKLTVEIRTDDHAGKVLARHHQLFNLYLLKWTNATVSES